jgi:hypothetical protein
MYGIKAIQVPHFQLRRSIESDTIEFVKFYLSSTASVGPTRLALPSTLCSCFYFG